MTTDSKLNHPLNRITVSYIVKYTHATRAMLGNGENSLKHFQYVEVEGFNNLLLYIIPFFC